MEQHLNRLHVFCPKETARVPETAGHLVAEAGRPPHDPGAEGKKHLLHHIQEERDHHHSPHVLMLLSVRQLSDKSCALNISLFIAVCAYMYRLL